jgi:hypothetical protein
MKSALPLLTRPLTPGTYSSRWTRGGRRMAESVLRELRPGAERTLHT